jgi:hypothetical protein
MSTQKMTLAVPMLCLLGASAAHADLTSVLGSGNLTAPIAIGFSNSTVTTGTVSGAFNFLDTWTFNLIGSANVQSLATSFVFGTPGTPGATFGISNLDVDLYSGSSIISAGTNTFVNGVPFTIFTSTTPSTLFTPGAYSLRVRGTIVGQPASYAGNLIAIAPSPVPLPAALPLLLLGMGGLGAMGRRRKAREAA